MRRSTRYFGILVAACAACACFTQANLPHGVTASNIRRIELGMTRGEVEKILGAPVSVESSPREGWTAESLIYFQRLPPLVVSFPKLWVHLREGKVQEVYAKRQDVVDDVGVYLFSNTVELSDSGRRWESPLFIETFPP